MRTSGLASTYAHSRIKSPKSVVGVVTSPKCTEPKKPSLVTHVCNQPSLVAHTCSSSPGERVKGRS